MGFNFLWVRILLDSLDLFRITGFYPNGYTKDMIEPVERQNHKPGIRNE
jgi:hypothetical protein